MNTIDLKKTSQKNIQIRLIFQTVSSIFTKIYVFFLTPYAWLGSYGHHGSFDTNISRSLSFSLVLLVLSSHNALNVTYSDTASYHFENSRKYQEQKLDGVAPVFINPLHAYLTPLLSPHLILQ